MGGEVGRRKKTKQNKTPARLVSLSSTHCTRTSLVFNAFIEFWFIWKLNWLLNLAYVNRKTTLISRNCITITMTDHIFIQSDIQS